jgi:hypothetical protein
MVDVSHTDRTLVLHEMHWVIGERAEQFEALYRDEYASALSGVDARLLYYFDHPDLGDAYVVVTMTEVRDGSAFERLNERLLEGDLADFALRADGMRRRSYGTVLRPVLPLRDVPPSADGDGSRLFRHDVIRSGRRRADELDHYRSGFEVGFSDALLQGVALFEPVVGWLASATAVVLYAMASFDQFSEVWSDDASETAWPGDLTPAFKSDDGQSESRILRPSLWSPCR